MFSTEVLLLEPDFEVRSVNGLALAVRLEFDQVPCLATSLVVGNVVSVLAFEVVQID